MIQKKKSFRLYIWLFWLFFIAPILLVIALFISISEGKMGEMPSIEQLENPKNFLASEVFSSDQKLLGKYFNQNRTTVKFNDLSPHLVDALVATEDIRFYEHSGIDFKALGRVVYGVISGNSRGGGSTVTQQLAKNLFPRKNFNNIFEIIIRKLQEWVIAVKLERTYSKEEIIALYFNKFDFLNLAVGIKSAARVYFNTTPDRLNIEQAATLVGMVKNPSIFNPRRNPDTTQHRRNVSLSQMLKYEYISRAEFDSLKLIPLNIDFQKVSHNLGMSTYFREYLRTTLNAKKPVRKAYASWQHTKFKEDSLEWETNPLYGWCNKNFKPDSTHYDLYKDGLKIYTTINSSMQKYAEEAVAEHLGEDLQPLFFKLEKNNKKAPFSWRISTKEIKKIMRASMHRSERYRVLKKAKQTEAEILKSFNTKTKMQVFSWHGDIDTVMTPMDSIRYYKYFFRAGLMSMEPQTGYVRAYVGGTNHTHFKYDHVKVAKRQVGSTFKPFLYTLAMQEGYHPCDKVPNIPVTFHMPEGQKDWMPRNSGKTKYDGKMVSLKWGLANSVNYISAYLMKQFNPAAVIKIARKMGVRSYIPAVPSICLGTADLSLFEMVGAYSTFANQGIYTNPIFVTRIEDKNGNVIANFKPKRVEAVSEKTAYTMLRLMEGVVNEGTSVRLRYKYKIKTQIAGKTGTTDNNSDGWFIGITPKLVTGIWVGGDERSIHFGRTLYGQGANMALPIWAIYMKKIYANASLGVANDKFQKPPNIDEIEIDCSKYSGGIQNEVENYDNELEEF